MLNKKGLSTIVVTVILVALVLVAVGIVWAVMSGIITRSTQTTDIAGMCVNAEVRVTSVDCTTPSACVVRLERTGLGTDALGGVKVVFKEANLTNSGVIDISGDIPALIGRTATVDSDLTAPTRLESTPYFLDSSGNQRLCSQTSVYNF